MTELLFPSLPSLTSPPPPFPPLPPPSPSCARLIENHEQLVEREAMLLKQLPPRRTSLVDTNLISAAFGLGAPPLDHRGR